MRGSNLRPLACKASALPAELILRQGTCLAASYSRGENFSTTISAEELNVCARYGNRCDLLAIATRHGKVLGRTFVILFSDKIYYISFMRKCKFFVAPSKLNKNQYINHEKC